MKRILTIGVMTGCAVIVVVLLEFTVRIHAYADTPRPAAKWEFVQSNEGIVTERGVIPDSPLEAFRGTGIVDARIGRVISVLFDDSRANEWVHGLAASMQLRALNGHGVVVWQRFDNPWPILDRDFVYRVEANYDEARKYFRAWFSDIADANIVLSDAERSRIPNPSCCVAAKLIYTEWQFRATGPESTCVRVEVMLDPKGSVPAPFVNWFQETWPYETIRGLRRQARKEDIDLHGVFGRWTADHPGSTISRTQCEQGQLAERSR